MRRRLYTNDGGSFLSVKKKKNKKAEYAVARDHRSYVARSCNLRLNKISGLDGIRTYDLCDSSANAPPLSHKARWDPSGRVATYL